MARPRKEQELDIARRAVEETIRLLAVRGDFDVPLSEVAQAVGCTAPALYSHFRNKNALLRAARDEGFRRLYKEKLAVEQQKIMKELGINPFASCLPTLIQFPIIIGLYQAIIQSMASTPLEMMNLTPRRGHKPGQLSGGEQQRVAIARALVNSPAVLLADEPSGNLDSHNRDEIHRLFFELRDRLGQTVVIVTHDEHLAAMADRKITMSDGRIL